MQRLYQCMFKNASWYVSKASVIKVLIITLTPEFVLSGSFIDVGSCEDSLYTHFYGCCSETCMYMILPSKVHKCTRYLMIDDRWRGATLSDCLRGGSNPCPAHYRPTTLIYQQPCLIPNSTVALLRCAQDDCCYAVTGHFS